jgi:2-C-methyl-D-erythritol 4-phosphate cytidylyltransferase
VTRSLGSSVGFVVVAAGRGERLGLDQPKALAEVAGRSLVGWAVDGLRAAGAETVLVVHPPGAEDAFRDAIGDDGVVLVPGGTDRSASVRAGLDALPTTVRIVAVHDAARAFTPPEVIRAAVAAVTGDVLAAAPALPVADTLKRADGHEVIATIDRSDLVAVQTPQVFPATVIRAVTADATSATDDLALVEQGRADGHLAGRVVWVRGSTRGAKITYPDDLRDAARFVEGRADERGRTDLG